MWNSAVSSQLGEPLRVGERVDIGNRFVASNCLDAWESQSETAQVSLARTNLVKRDLQNDLGLDGAESSTLLQGVFREMLRQFLDFRIGESSVSFADSEKLAGLIVANCKRVVAKQMASLSVSLLSADDNDVEGCCGPFQFHPREISTTRLVDTERFFHDQALVPPLQRIAQCCLN